MKLILGLLAAATLAGCTLDTGPKDINTDPSTETFAATLGVDIPNMTKDLAGSEVVDYHKDLTPGTGPTIVGDGYVGFDYTAYIKDGTAWDIGSIDVASQTQTVGTLISGLADGMQGMQVGGERLIVIPSDFAFGTGTVTGSTGVTVPPNTTVIYDIKLTGIAALP